MKRSLAVSRFDHCVGVLVRIPCDIITISSYFRMSYVPLQRRRGKVVAEIERQVDWWIHKHGSNPGASWYIDLIVDWKVDWWIHKHGSNPGASWYIDLIVDWLVHWFDS